MCGCKCGSGTESSPGPAARKAVSIQLRGLEPEVRQRAQLTLDWAARFGIRPIVTSGYRSWHKQNELYQRFLAGKSRFPANPPGQSAHNFRLAWDSVLPAEISELAGAQEWWNSVREAAGFRVPSNDEIHAAVPNWRSFV